MTITTARGIDVPTLAEALREAVARLSSSSAVPAVTDTEAADDIASAIGLGSSSSHGDPTNARLDAEVLLCAAAATNRAGLFAWPERILESAQQARYRQLIERRASGEPIAYILGHREFWGLELQVAPPTLIPRSDTELLVESALAALPADRCLVCADLGTGSGAVAAALAHERPAWLLIAVERSAGAAGIAAANAHRLGLEQLLVVRADWLCAIAPGRVDAIVSNPPYIRVDDPHLDRGDLRFEPRASLAAGADGLDAIRAIVSQSPAALRPGGWIGIEHGWDQGATVRGLLEAAGFAGVKTHRDLAGHERVSSGRKEGPVLTISDP